MSLHAQKRPGRRWLRRAAWMFGGLMVAAGAAAVALVVFGRPAVSVAQADGALFRVHVRGFGASLASLQATTSGKTLATAHAGGGYIPASPVAQGQSVTVRAHVAAPGWLGWLVGSGASTVRTVAAPKAEPATKVTVSNTPGQVQLSFTGPVAAVTYQEPGQPSRTVKADPPSSTVTLPVQKAPAGSLMVAATPREWESAPVEPSQITWFVSPADGGPEALVDPAPGSVTADSDQPIRITFDQPVAAVLGTSHPKLTPAVPGTWSQPGPDTLVFTPSGFGFGPGATVTVSFDRPVSTVGATVGTDPASEASTSSAYTFVVAPGSELRLEQILAQLHYLPLDFTPASGVALPTTMAEEVTSMAHPLDGTFSWRWSTTPAGLQAEWTEGTPNQLVKGALMAFDSVRGQYDGYQAESETVAQLADASMWQALLQAALADQLDPHPYSYVYVNKALPESLTLWQDGSVVLTSAANTGITQEPTADGTFAVYIRFTQNWMSGTNPDGSTYHDLVNWISYFNGSDAVHAFPRASYGSPQSLGCVELPDAAGQTAFDDMAIGDLVTVAG